MSKFLILLICLFSLNSYGFLEPCESIFETETETPQYFDANKKLPGQILSSAQIKILFRILMGDTDQQILERLGMRSQNTLRAYVDRMFNKLNIHRRNALASYAIHKKIITPEMALKTSGYTRSYYGEAINGYDTSLVDEITGAESPFRLSYSGFADLGVEERLVLFYSILGFSIKETSRETGETVKGVEYRRSRIFEIMQSNNLSVICARAIGLKIFGELTDDMFTDYRFSVDRARAIINSPLR